MLPIEQKLHVAERDLREALLRSEQLEMERDALQETVTKQRALIDRLEQQASKRKRRND